MTSFQEPDLEYIKTSGIGKVMAQALGNMYRANPKFPIDYLAKWLDNYCLQRAFDQRLDTHDRSTQDQHLQHQNDLKDARDKEAFAEALREKESQRLIAVRRKIEEADDHERLVESFIPHEVFSKVDLTGVYIGYYAPVKTTPGDDELDGGDDQKQGSGYVLQYVGGDEKSMEILKGKFLPEGAGVTYEVFRTEADNPDQPDDGAAKQPSIKDENGCVYVPDVVMNSSMYYFKIPRLGAFFAAPMVIKSYLNDASFDDAVIKLKAYAESVRESEAQKQAKLDELNEQLENAKINNEEEAQRINDEIEEIEANWEPVPEPVFEADPKMYVLCCDTLGKDRQISKEDRDFIFDLSQHFKSSWENRELRLIKDQAEAFIKYEIEERPEERLFSLEESLEREYKMNMEIIDPDETLAGLDVKYKENEAKRVVLLEQLYSEGVRKTLLSLANFQFIKYMTVVQLAFILAGYKKEDINLPDTDTLDWRKMRAHFNEGLLAKLSDYEYRGPKTHAVPSYAMIPALRKRINKFGVCDRETELRAKSGDPELNVLRVVSHFNYGLGRLFLLIDLIISLRDADILLRRERFKQMRVQRVDAIERKRVRNNRKEEEMAEAKNEEGENFNQADWLAAFEENNPEIEIPEEPAKDVDLDYDQPEEIADATQDSVDGQADGAPQDQPADDVNQDDANDNPQ